MCEECERLKALNEVLQHGAVNMAKINCDKIAEISALEAENKKLIEQIYVMKSLVENANEKVQQNWLDGIKVLADKNDAIAALVTALDEATFIPWLKIIQPDGSERWEHNYRDINRLSPASRAVAEKFLKDK